MGLSVREVGVKEVKASVPRLYIPTWVIRDLGFEPGDRPDWVPLADDKGEKFVALRRLPKKKEGEGEGEEKKGGDEEKKEE